MFSWLKAYCETDNRTLWYGTRWVRRTEWVPVRLFFTTSRLEKILQYSLFLRVLSLWYTLPQLEEKCLSVSPKGRLQQHLLPDRNRLKTTERSPETGQFLSLSLSLFFFKKYIYGGL
jgi:hypothetical protein